MGALGKAFLISALCVCAAFSFENILNIERILHSGRVIGGDEAARGQFPWQAEIETIVNNESVTYCGGALISKDYIITAAQCIPPDATIHVLLGAHNITDDTEVGRVDLISDFYFIHPNFTNTSLNNDLAVIHLPRAVISSPYVSPARLPPAADANDTYIGWLGRFSGWGAAEDGMQGNYSEILRFADNLIVDQKFCTAHYANGTVTDKHICMSTTGARSPCRGDQGSPLVIQDKQGKFYQVGIFTFYDTESCINGIPVVFTRLESHLEWIYSVTGIPPTD